MGKIKNVLLVQPHSDDILFSASYYLFNRDKFGDVVLFTVEQDEKRLEEDVKLCEIFNLDLICGDLLKDDKTYYEYYKTFKNTVFSYEESSNVMTSVYGSAFLKSLRKEIRDVVQTYKDKGYEIVVCLGIGHPTHWFVRKSIIDLADTFYRDFPHSYKRKTQKCLEETLGEFKLKRTFDVKDFNDLKFEISNNVYKTQRSLLFFEKGYIDKKINEEFYAKR